MKQKYFRIIWPALLLFANLLLAQNGGKIAGVVIDGTDGEPLAGANVFVDGTPYGAATDIEGSYVILRVPPGKYEVSVYYIGYQKYVYKDVEILTDLTTKLNFSIKPEVFEGEEITVVAEAPVIRKDLTSVESRVQAEDIERMPAQEMSDLIDMQAGVTRDAGGGLHIRGGRSSEVSYMVNGISITDDFSRTQSVEIENESIQELQVISGTFNAEYGNAMSGIINVITKTGSNEYTGNFEVWSGDYISGKDKVFFNIDDVNPFADYNFQGSVGGPIIKNKLTFFVTGRRWYTDGWLYGANAFKPQGMLDVVDGDTVTVPAPDDSSAVAMNFRDRWSGQATLEWRITNTFKLGVDVLGSWEKRNNYNHFAKLNPMGDKGDVDRGLTVISKFTHQIGAQTFQELTYAHKYSYLVSKLYDKYTDPRYVDPSLVTGEALQFSNYGTDNSRYWRYGHSNIVKWELTSQINHRNQVKAGLDVQYDKVFENSYSLIANIGAAEGEEAFRIPDISESSHSRFTRRPFKAAAFVQDKIEYESLIINVGLRFDYFDAKGKIPTDSEDPNIYNPLKLENKYFDLNNDGEIGSDEQVDSNLKSVEDRRPSWYKKTSVKYLLSPRLGVAYPITERGVIHFSYGIFQQVPDYSQLYVGDEIKVTTAAGTQGVFGNPDLKPQKTIMYELGLQQQFTDNLSIDLTGYFRDIRDWTSTSPLIPTFLSGVNYVRFRNRDFANIRGITLSIDRKYADNFSFNIDYTYQIAEGTNSDPTQEFFAQQDGAEPTKILTPLNWDQRHALNGNFYVGGDTWGSSLRAYFNSGQPYTPSFVPGTRTGQTIISGLRENSRSKPYQFAVDLNMYKNFEFGGFEFQVFMNVYNLFDADNPVDIFSDTGEVDYSLYEATYGSLAGPTFFVIPAFYSEPRRIQVGTKISFE